MALNPLEGKIYNVDRVNDITMIAISNSYFVYLNRTLIAGIANLKLLPSPIKKGQGHVLTLPLVLPSVGAYILSSSFAASAINPSLEIRFPGEAQWQEGGQHG